MLLLALFPLNIHTGLSVTVRVLDEPATATELAAPAGLDTVHVAYASDSSGFTGLLASMLSLSRRLKDPQHCTIHLIVVKADMAKAESLLECFRSELTGQVPAVPKVVLHELQAVPFAYANIIKRLNICREQAIARIYLHKYLPDIDRVLYLDFDTIVKDDIGSLYRMPMKHAFAAAVQSEETPTHMYSKKFGPLVGLFKQPQAHTFNTGVLLMDLRRWRSENVTGSVEQWMQRTQVVEDQLLLNLAFQPGEGGYDEIGAEWNTCNLGCGAIRGPKTLSAAKILHWSCMWKPWTKKYGNHANYKNYWEAPKACKAAEADLHISW